MDRFDCNLDKAGAQIRDLAKGPFGQINHAIQPFRRTAIIDAADNRALIFDIGHAQARPKRIVPAGAGQLRIVKNLPVSGMAVNAGIGLTIPGSNAIDGLAGQGRRHREHGFVRNRERFRKNHGKRGQKQH